MLSVRRAARLQIQWLKTFVATAQYENFRRAAEKLFVTQPTVTMHIKHLEELLGTELFERRGRNVHITHAGRRFLPYAEQMLSNFETGMHEIESWRQGFTRKITIAVSPLVAASTLPLIVRKYLKSYPDIEIAIKVMESVEIGEAVARGAADIGLSRMRSSEAGLTVRKLNDDPVVLVAPGDATDEKGTSVPLERLLRRYLILTHNHPEYWDGLLNEIRIDYPRIRTMTVSQVYITKRFIEEGLGISFLPSSTVVEEIEQGKVVELRTDELSLPVASTYLIHQSETEEVQHFLGFIIDFYDKIVDDPLGWRWMQSHEGETAGGQDFR